MNHLSRRDFITRSATALAGTALLSPGMLRAGHHAVLSQIGFQTWIVRESIEKDFVGTLKTMAGLGYNSFELCSPQGYAKMGFAPLQNMKASELKKTIKDAGFSCISCHYGLGELRDHAQERIDYAKELGLTQMVISSFGLPKEATLSDWKKAADESNKIAEMSKKAGIQLGFHNHDVEFSTLDGELIYDVLLKQFDASLVKMQFQVSVIHLGFKAADYFRKHPGRFISAHLYDWPGQGEEMVPLGTGKVDWKDFFAAAKVGGVKNYYVEMKEGLAESAAFLKKLS